MDNNPVLMTNGILVKLESIAECSPWRLGVSGFGDICHFSFRDVGYFSKYLKGYGILGPPNSV